MKESEERSSNIDEQKARIRQRYKGIDPEELEVIPALPPEDYIADNIIALCKKRDMSKYRLSQLTGISQSSIGKIIAKESLPTMPTVEKICDALGVTMAQFFAGMDVPVSLSESQQEVLNIWNNLDEKEQNVVIQMLRGLQK